uniref:Uncharacterized protein n=1 Tax=Arundo donax TaxID=35708 RepID=A0A0A9DNP7_ARUDO
MVKKRTGLCSFGSSRHRVIWAFRLGSLVDSFFFYYILYLLYILIYIYRIDVSLILKKTPYRCVGVSVSRIGAS